jgi:hypothetical protein
MMAEDIFTVKTEPFKIPPPPRADLLKTDVNAPPIPPIPKLSQQITSARQSPEKVRDIQATNLQKIAENERAISQTKLAQEQYGAEAEADIARQEATQVRKIESDYQDFRKNWPLPELHPTKDNIQTLTGLFSLIGVIGAAMGGQGRMSAQGALQSMTGMMKGWQQGRADLWKKEKDEFEANFKRVKVILDDAKSDADRAMKLMAYDTKEAQAAAKQAAVKLGSQVANQILENQGLEKFNDYLNGVVKDYQHLENIREQRAAKAQAHADALAAKEDARKAKEGEGYTPTGAAQDHILSNRDFIRDVSSLKQKLNDPEFAKRLNQYRVQLFASEESKAIDQLLQQKIPQDVRQFAIQLKDVRNKKYKEMSGAAVTGSEAMRNFGVYAQPSDTADTARDKLNIALSGAINRDRDNQRVYPKFYQLLNAGQTQTYKIGDIIPKGDKKYRVIGGNPSDPDVEEVK